ncbi:MAG: FAD-binding oxidoreductase [Chloroflexi bacterium]|nr:FAD-binding oxidoreductase [Chloroflexota bacterium]
MKPKVVIIGGGVIGASCAYYLAKKGVHDLTVVEKGALGSGSTGRSAAEVRSQDVDDPHLHFTSTSILLFRELAKTRGLPFVQSGYLRLGHADEHNRLFHRSAAIQRNYGLTHARVLEPAEIAALAPGIRTDDLSGGLFGPEDGFIDPVVYVNILVDEARSAGGRLMAGTTVTGIKVANGRVQGVETDRGYLPADVVVNAAGAWARQVGRMAGVDVPVEGYRRQIVILEPDRPLPTIPFIIDYVPGSGREGLYFRSETSGRILVSIHGRGAAGAERPEDPDRYQETNDPAFIEKIQRLLAERWPTALEFGITGGWAGLYPITPDSEPILGEAPGLAGFYNAVGFNGYGVQNSPIAGQILAELIADGQVQVIGDLAPFRLERFAQKSQAATIG